MGTANLAEAARISIPNLKKFIFASSVEVYGNQKKYPVNEDTPTAAASPYGVAKIAAEQYLLFLHRAYGFPCIIFRNTNSYGRTHDDYFVIEHTIVQMLEDRNKIKMGDPKPVRDFIYIEDEISAYLAAIETSKDIIGEIFIPGTGKVISIGDLVELIHKMIGYKGEVEWNTISYRPCEIWRIEVDPSKIKHVLGWKAKYSLEEGLEKTIGIWKNKISTRVMSADMGRIPRVVSD
jgi:nucleoside-diphosphate-sugar epimerase